VRRYALALDQARCINFSILYEKLRRAIEQLDGGAAAEAIMDDTESDEAEAEEARSAARIDDEGADGKAHPPADVDDGPGRGKGRGRGRGRGRGGGGAGAAGGGGDGAGAGAALLGARGGRGRGRGRSKVNETARDQGALDSVKDASGESSLGARAVALEEAPGTHDERGVNESAAGGWSGDVDGEKSTQVQGNMGSGKSAQAQSRGEGAVPDAGPKSAKPPFVQAFLGRFNAARQALPDAEIVEYAKGQRLSEQDAKLLHDAGSWVLENYGADVLGLDEAALRKKLQVEVRLHMKNAATSKGAAAAKEQQKLERLAQEEEKKRQRQEAAEEKRRLKAAAAEERGAKKRGKQGKVLNLEEDGVEERATGPGGEGGESVSRQEEVADDGRALRKRAKSSQPMYAEQGSDEEFLEEDEDNDDDDEVVVVRGGGAGARGRKTGRGGDRGAGDAGRPDKRRRESKLVGTVWHGGKDAGGSKAEAVDEVAHATSREEALRQVRALQRSGVRGVLEVCDDG